MKKFFSSLLLMLAFVNVAAWADDATWSFKWDKSRSDGGEGFYHITSNDETTQTATLNTLQWTFSSNTSVTAYTGSAGQYFGSAKSPVTHGTLSTEYLAGKIKSVTIEAKKKADTDVTLGVSVNDKDYKCSEATAAQMTTDWASYSFTPEADAEEGKIVITMDQTSETTGPIYFLSISIVYEGEGVVAPEIVKVSPGLKYETTLVQVEAGDNAYANYLSNPHNVSPITYKAADETIAVIGSNGNIFTTGKVGTTTVTASFAGNDNYLADEASYTLEVIAKPVIPAPTVSVAAGTYTEAQTITITSDDALCKAIWYSVTAKDSLELVDDPIIVAGNTATITLSESCTLRCCAVGDNNIGCVLEVPYIFNIPLQAAFGADESKKTYYQMGWDSVEEAQTWKYYGINENKTWTLTASPSLSGTQSFSTIDPESKYSLSIMYDNSDQRERAVSPEITIRQNSNVEFYACFNGVWLTYADWKLNVIDLEDDSTHQLVSGFKWAQDNAFTGPNWVYFSFDLAAFTGHKCQFEFLYEGNYGDNMSIDGFKINEQDMSPDAKINIKQGESVHFKDLSAGSPEAWAWTFEGADIESSTEQNPVITYSKAGEYTVSLTVKKGDEEDSTTKEQFVIVSVEAPQAHIGLPEGAYLSPWAYAFVPTNVPVTYNDASSGQPTSWAWTFEGTDIASSTEQNPTVSYTEEGMFGLDLTVSNEAGTDRDFLVSAIKAGGSLDVWNIAAEENGSLAEITMGWYGSYAGTNWLGIKTFAERFHKPLAEASIDKVTVYFANTKADDQEAEITVAICPADESGMPGEAIASASLKVSELKYDDTEVVPTEFVFDNAVDVNTDFFITISGFPNTGYTDDVAVLCAHRNLGEKNTAYHLLEDEDENYQPLGTYSWYANDEDPLSMAMTAHLTYNNVATAISNANADTAATGVYNINGMRVAESAGKLAPGIYVVKSGEKTRKIMVK